MKQYYVGVKIVEAEEEEKDGKPGYKVKYSDGYTSWSPKEVFEEAYLPIGEDPTTVNSEMVDLFIGSNMQTTRVDKKTTLLAVETITGFTQYATSSCVDPANYDEKIGFEACLNRIKDTIWKHLGFVLQWGIFGLNRG